MNTRERSRVLVIGLDGATWNLIEPLVRDRKLPIIARLMNGGCYGDLESSIPASTFPAWKCYSTGKNPGKLGVYWFLGVDVAKRKITLHNSTSFKSKELWDYLGENDITCGVLDMPTTYPPKAINGAMVSQGAPRRSGFTYPQSLEQQLKERFDYKLDPDYFPELSKDAAIPSIKEIINQRFDVASYLLKELNPSFFHLTIVNIDTMQHHYWKDMEDGDAKYGRVLEDFWVLIDSRIGSLLDEFGDEKTYVFLMSDHGQTRIKGMFCINRWLQERNLLTLKSQTLSQTRLLARLSLTHTAVGHAVRAIATVLPLRSWIQKMIARHGLSDLSASLIDWMQSRVIPTSTGLLYINRALFSSEDQLENFKEGLIEELKGIEEPKTGQRLASEVYRGEEIYWGRYVDQAPDIVILPNEGYPIISSTIRRETWDYSTEHWTAAHRLQGIFLACGPDMKKGIEIEGAKIYDLAPTILHIFGIPIPKDMDGRVLKEIFEEGSALAKKEIEYQRVDEKARVKQKIKELKSIGKI